MCRNRVKDVRNGYYTCKNAESECDFDCCVDCYKGKKDFQSGLTCDKGDLLKYSIAPRRRAPYNGAIAIRCDVCKKNVPDVRKGYYNCCKSEVDCSYDVCIECFKGKKEARPGFTCD